MKSVTPAGGFRSERAKVQYLCTLVLIACGRSCRENIPQLLAHHLQTKRGSHLCGALGSVNLSNIMYNTHTNILNHLPSNIYETNSTYLLIIDYVLPAELPFNNYHSINLHNYYFSL